MKYPAIRKNSGIWNEKHVAMAHCAVFDGSTNIDSMAACPSTTHRMPMPLAISKKRIRCTACILGPSLSRTARGPGAVPGPRALQPVADQSFLSIGSICSSYAVSA